MKSQEFKILISVQIITLILVVIIFINSLSNESKSVESNGVAIQMTKPENGSIKLDAKNDYVYGNNNAPNFLIVFSRYNCEICQQFYRTVFDSLNNNYIKQGKLKIVYKELVDTSDKVGLYMAKIAEVARQTNHFEEIQNLFSQKQMPNDSIEVLRLALKSGLSKSEINTRINSNETLDKILQDNFSAKQLNITGTPSFVLNGKVIIGYLNYKTIIQELEKKEKQTNQD